MSARRDRRKGDGDRRRFVVELGGKSVIVISRRDGVQHFAYPCAYHSVEEMSECDLCRLAMRGVNQLATYRDITEPDARAWRAAWHAAQGEAVA